MNFIETQFANNKKLFIAAGIVLLILIASSVVFFYFRTEADRYYAVFLSNNQVYFGNIYNIDGGYITLKNSVYLQSDDQNDPQKIKLVRRGTEIHLPTGEMKINRSNVLFIEELSKNSPVAISVREYKKSQAK